jgi:hypothetical protein
VTIVGQQTPYRVKLTIIQETLLNAKNYIKNLPEKLAVITIPLENFI